MQEEYDALGEPYESRGARHDEIVDIMRKLWTGKPVSHQGRFYSFGAVQHSPALSSPIPIIGCGLSAVALRRAAKLDGWYSPGVALEFSLKAVADLRRLHDAEPHLRKYEVFVRLTGEATVENLDRFARAGVTDVVIGLPAFGVTSSDSLETQVDAVHRAAALVSEFASDLRL
jgi:alkanesulfonate monooxygenase SsuD/methylene tetrahydromethanopterin reductase-like flavin-dependent oxidoreductase (luciferase family)